MFVKTLKIVLSLMVLTIVVIIFLFVTGTCHDYRVLKEKLATITVDKAIIVESKTNTGSAPETWEGKSILDQIGSR
jgi:hypothetical protein